MGLAEMFPTHMVRFSIDLFNFLQNKPQSSGAGNKCLLFKLKNSLQDFEGQGRAERLSRIIITLFGVVGLFWGGFVQQFSQTILILAAGVLLTLVVSSHTNGQSTVSMRDILELAAIF